MHELHLYCVGIAAELYASELSVLLEPKRPNSDYVLGPNLLRLINWEVCCIWVQRDSQCSVLNRKQNRVTNCAPWVHNRVKWKSTWDRKFWGKPIYLWISATAAQLDCKAQYHRSPLTGQSAHSRKCTDFLQLLTPNRGFGRNPVWRFFWFRNWTSCGTFIRSLSERRLRVKIFHSEFRVYCNLLCCLSDPIGGLVYFWEMQLQAGKENPRLDEQSSGLEQLALNSGWFISGYGCQRDDLTLVVYIRWLETLRAAHELLLRHFLQFFSDRVRCIRGIKLVLKF